MNERKIMFDSCRFSVSQDIKEKLLKSQLDAEKATKKTVYCPVCGARLLEIYSDDKPIVQVKCRKCKLEQPINILYFQAKRA